MISEYKEAKQKKMRGSLKIDSQKGGLSRRSTTSHRVIGIRSIWRVHVHLRVSMPSARNASIPSLHTTGQTVPLSFETRKTWTLRKHAVIILSETLTTANSCSHPERVVLLRNVLPRLGTNCILWSDYETADKRSSRAVLIGPLWEVFQINRGHRNNT